jgi:single-strand DNA-binding protein
VINKTFLLGRLTHDPEVRITNDGLHVATARLATNVYAGKDDEGNAKEHTEFHRLVLFGKQAENAGAILRRGRMVFIDGRLQTRTWDGQDGQKHYMTEVVVETWKAVGPRTESETEAA